MAEPTYSELANSNVNPELGSGTPAVVIPQSDVVRTLNENARVKSQNDMDKYKMFTQRLSDVFQQGIDLAGTEVRAVDRDKLASDFSSALAPILKDPHQFMSAQGQADTYNKLYQLKLDATKSKSANTLNQASREWLNKTPSFDTDINRDLVKNGDSVPLDQFKPYVFDYQPHLDLSSVSKDIYANGGKGANQFATKYSEFSPDNKFINSGTNYNKDGYLKNWNDKLLDPSIRKAVKTQYYDQLPDNLKKTYTKADGTPDLESLWNHLGQGTFVNEGKQVEKQIANPFELETQRMKDKGRELGIKYGYDKGIANLKQAGVLDAIKVRALYKNGGKTIKDENGHDKTVPQNEFFDDAFDIILSDAAKPDNAILDKDNNIVGYKVNVSDNTKKTYGRDEKDEATGVVTRVPADYVTLSPDGKYISSTFMGDKTTTKMTVDEAKGLMYKSLGNLTNVGGITSGSTAKKNTPTKEKTISNSTIKSLVGTKGYEGYTQKELADYYKSNGYEIK